MKNECHEHLVQEGQLKKFRAKILEIREILKDGNLGDKKFDVKKLGYEEMGLFEQYKKLCELILALDENVAIEDLDTIDEAYDKFLERININKEEGDLFRGFLLNQLAFMSTLSMYKIEPENKNEIIKEAKKLVQKFN